MKSNYQLYPDLRAGITTLKIPLTYKNSWTVCLFLPALYDVVISSELPASVCLELNPLCKLVQLTCLQVLTNVMGLSSLSKQCCWVRLYFDHKLCSWRTTRAPILSWWTFWNVIHKSTRQPSLELKSLLRNINFIASKVRLCYPFIFGYMHWRKVVGR
jgi:hypothetical protein